MCKTAASPRSSSSRPRYSAPVRYIRNGRDISHYVRLDALFQAYFVATLNLVNGVTLNETTSPFVYRFPFDAGNPYGPDGSTLVQAGFGTFGNPALLTLVTEPAPRALKAVWFQKWQVHRRLRPEAFGGRVEAMRLNLGTYPDSRGSSHRLLGFEHDSGAERELICWGRLSPRARLSIPPTAPATPRWRARASRC